MNNILNIFSDKRVLFVFSAIIFLSSLVLLTLFKSAESLIVNQRQAVMFTEEMIESSDKLTNYARFHIATKSDEWKNQFNKVLEVRNGIIADENGVKKSFGDKLKENTFFLKEEIDILLEAEKLSNNLAKIEKEAFQLIEMWKKETNDEYQLGLANKAQFLIFGDEYKKYKNEIDNKSKMFYDTVINRLKHDYEKTMFYAWSLITIINVSLLMLVVGIMQFKNSVARKPTKKTAKKIYK